MELIHLKKTLETCIEYHRERNNETKVKQLENKLKEVETKRLEGSNKFNGLCLD